MLRQLSDLLDGLVERHAYRIALASAIYLLSAGVGVASFDWARAGFSVLFCYLGITIFIQADQVRRSRRAADRAADAADAAERNYRAVLLEEEAADKREAEDAAEADRRYHELLARDRAQQTEQGSAP